MQYILVCLWANYVNLCIVVGTLTIIRTVAKWRCRHENMAYTCAFRYYCPDCRTFHCEIPHP